MLIQRKQYLDKIIRNKDNGMIKAITGIRRSGKSVLLFELFYNYLKDNGVGDGHIIKIDLEQPSCFSLRKADALYNYIKGRATDGERYYILIDEVQHIDSFEDIINGINAEFNCDMYITGSNSKLLTSEINTLMRGRSIDIKVYPLSFKEMFDFYGGSEREQLRKYIIYGGMPQLLNTPDDSDKSEYLEMLCDTVIRRDIIERYGIKRPQVFNAVTDFLYSNIGSYVSAKKIADTLTSNGIKVTPDTVENYLEFLCNAFLFYKAQRYDIKGNAYLKTLNKYYATDLGMRNVRLKLRQIEQTHAIENIVYLELLRRGYNVDIGKNNNKEIDFIARSHNDQYYIQVAYSIEGEGKLEQEISSFYKIDDGFKKIVITMDEPLFSVTRTGYRVVNLIEFLLKDNILETI